MNELTELRSFCSADNLLGASAGNAAIISQIRALWNRVNRSGCLIGKYSVIYSSWAGTNLHIRRWPSARADEINVGNETVGA